MGRPVLQSDALAHAQIVSAAAGQIQAQIQAQAAVQAQAQVANASLKHPFF